MDKERTEIEREVRSWLSTTTPWQAREMLPRARECLTAMRAEYYQALAKVKCLEHIIEEATDAGR